MLSVSKRFSSISWLLIAVMLWTYGGGVTYAQSRSRERIDQQRPSSSARPAFRPTTREQIRFDEFLSELKDALKQPVDTQRVIDLRERLIQENEKVRAFFSDIEASLKEKGLPEEILGRHLKFVRDYEAKYETLMANLEAIESAEKLPAGFWGELARRTIPFTTGAMNRDEAIEKTLRFLKENTAPPRKRHFDPKNLPHRSLRPGKPIPPKLTPEEWRRAFPKHSSRSNTSDDETGSTFTALSAVADFFVATAEAATVPSPTPDDLAETVEVKFTPEITQLARSLENNPVKIFNWVRNNIQFVPTWGSIQGAQLCLETKSCNAFDTASLLIALLRVAGIPARYQMGTIEVPIDRFMNWAGGFTNADAAASLFASGGVPSVVRRVDETNRVVSVKLEHVWVNAFVDYIPSGGAVNIGGDTWAGIDPSFKQVIINRPQVYLTDVVPFNRDNYLASSATASPVEFYRQTLENHVQANFPGQTLDDFLTKKSVVVEEPPILAASLPYGVLVVGENFSATPDSLRQRVSIQVGSGGVATMLSYTVTMPEVLGKRITLSFIPGSVADVETAASFQGMYFTPPYLLSVKPLLRIDGVEVATGDPAKMGQPLNMSLRFDPPGGSQRTVQNEISAGAYNAIILAPHIFTDGLADALGNALRGTDSRYGTLNIDNSDRDPWVGGGLQALGTYYFNRLDASIGLLKQFFPIGQLKSFFEAAVSADVQVFSLFGAPRGIQLRGISIDADLLEDVAFARDGDVGRATAYQKLRGLESSFWEHGIFEVSGPIPGSLAISTVRLLQSALASGIQVFKIDADNLAAVEPLLQLSEKDEEAVRNGVNAGLEITIAATNLQLGEWSGVGYIIEDPLTGAGAYQISGGLSGGTTNIGFDMVHPALAGAAVPLQGSPGRPNAILAIAFPKQTGLRGFLEWTVGANEWVWADSLGTILFNGGYNVYVRQIWGDDAPKIIAGAGGASTPNDIITIVSHGDEGYLAMPKNPPKDDWFVGTYSPGYFGGREFKVALLIGCNTGRYCPFGPATCGPSQEQREKWAASFLGPGPYTQKALVGFNESVAAYLTLSGAKTFWLGMLNKNKVGEMAGFSFFYDFYVVGDQGTTLR